LCAGPSTLVHCPRGAFSAAAKGVSSTPCIRTCAQNWMLHFGRDAPWRRRAACETQDASRFPGQPTGSRVARRKIDGDEYLERLESFPPISLRKGFPSQGADDVVIVQWVAESVDRRGLIARLLDQLVVRIRLGKLPLLELVHGDAAELHGPLLPEN